MSRIKSKGTLPEVLFRKELWKYGVRYRINVAKLPGCPDVVIKKKMTVVFIDGEFWHGYDWEKKKKKIKANRGFWLPKIERNIQRDLENNLRLKKLGYKVFRFWEHELKKNRPKCLNKVVRWCAK
jgi:DNA mismatch endonuclease (patch repair protein)